MQIKARDYRSGKGITLTIQGNRVAEVEQASDVPDLWVAPALLDLQLNGFGGRNFNSPDTGPEVVREILEGQWALGVGRLCPTICTNSEETMLACLRRIAQACQDPAVADAIPGIHVEGPYISPEEGPRGAHPLAHVRPPDWDEFCRWQKAAEDRIRLVTLAPEHDGAIPFIERLTDAGVVAAIGHTAAIPEDIQRAVDAGARLSTHLGNGAHSLLPRHPNYIWEQLSQDALSASLIVDGFHLPSSVVKCMVRCKTLERTVLISDAVTFAGMPPGRYTSGGRTVEVSEQGRVSLAGTPYLAGAGLDLTRCVANFVRFVGCEFADAVDAASRTPATLIGETVPGTHPGARADLMLSDWEDGQIRVQQTIVGGEIRYRA